MLSAGATFAADGDSALTTLDDEIIVDVLSVEEDSETLDVDEQTVLETDDVSDVVGETKTVTNTTFHDYFDEYGTLTSDADELVFEGDFTGIDVNYITIDKSVKLTGNEAVFSGVKFVINANNVVIDGFKLSQDKDMVFTVSDSSNVTLSNNEMDYAALDGQSSYAIFAYDIDNLKILNNIITYVGNSNGQVVNNAIRVYGDEKKSTNIQVSGNKFNIAMPSTNIRYDASYNSESYTDGFVFLNCDGIHFTDNNVTLEYNDVVGSVDTIKVLVIGNGNYDLDDDFEIIYPKVCSNVVVSNNNITAKGHTYLYGISVVADNFEINDNYLNVSSENYVAAFEINGPSSEGNISNNIIVATSPKSAYGIYSYAMSGPIDGMNYFKNTIIVNAYEACGMEVINDYADIVENGIMIFGNHTTGIVANMEGTIIDNDVSALGSNIGKEPTVDGYIHMESTGLAINGNVLIEGNNMSSTAVGIELKKHTTAGEIMLYNNNITVEAKGNLSNYAIYAQEMDSLIVSSNNITFNGTTDGVSVTNAVFIGETDNVVMSDNSIVISIPSAAVVWAPDWSTSTVISEGIVVDSCNDFRFENNNLGVDYNDVIGAYDTIYAIDIKNSRNAIVNKNRLGVAGHSYMYGILISGENFTVSNNNIISSSDVNYANGIDVEGPASGVITNNSIEASAPISAYPVYGAMSNGNVTVNITDNEIYGNAYLVYGVQIAGKTIMLDNNNITAKGNHTIGVGTYVDDIMIINNKIIVDASNEGNMSSGDTMGADTAGIKITKGGAEISDNTIQSPSIGINAVGAKSVNIDSVAINVAADGKADNYAVYADGVGAFTMTNDNVTFIGKTNGTTISNAIHLVDCGADGLAVVSGNNFNIFVPSAAVVWAPDWSSSTVISEGIVVDSCDGFRFENNKFNLTYNDVIGAYDTIYAIDILNSNNALIKDNEINAKGNGYMYAVKITGDKFTIDSNNISVESNDYANGVDVEGPAAGVISNNGILAKADNSAYPIYSGMNYQPVSVNITGNDLVGEAYYAIGAELAGQETIVKDNNINVKGNHTMGIASTVDKLTIDNNQIVSDASNEGNKPVGDTMGANTTGIKIADGQATISNNNVKTTGDYAIDVGDSKSTIKPNHVESAKGTGVNAVHSTGNATIDVKFKTSITAPSTVTVLLTKVKSGYTIKVVLKDSNGLVLAKSPITVNGKPFTTDGNGVVNYKVSASKVGTQTLTINYAGNDDYAASTAKVTVKITKEATKLTAKKKTFKAKKKIKKYTVTLKDSKKKAIKKVKVTLKIKGKKYTAKTNAKGKATFKIKKLTKKGTYKAKVRFAGNALYKASSKTVKIKVKK